MAKNDKIWKIMTIFTLITAIHLFRIFCNIGFQEKCHFFAQNKRKSPKIVIITLTPVLEYILTHFLVQLSRPWVF
jgi:hypothetical protein